LKIRRIIFLDGNLTTVIMRTVDTIHELYRT
jgi:hypothetical protein